MFLLLDAPIIEAVWFCVTLWLVFFVAALAIELSTEQLVSVWFCGGALVSAVLAACKVPFFVQIIVFVVVSAGLLVLSRTTFAKKLLLKKDAKTNYDSVLGKRVKMTESVSPDKHGAAKVRDVTWTVASEDTIAVGEYAIVKKIEGNKLIVIKEEK